MTWKELKDKISLMTEEEQRQEVAVWGENMNLMKDCSLEKTDEDMQIAESDDLFDKQIHKVRKFYLSRNPDKMMMPEERKAVIKERNKGLSPEYDKEYYCGTCGAKDGAEHPKTGYCFHCDTDNWISKK